MVGTRWNSRDGRSVSAQGADSDAGKPYRITMTGADPSCFLDDLAGLLEIEPRLELGLLYSETQQGSGRYPPAAWIQETVATLERKVGRLARRVALHICGRAVWKFLEEGPQILGVGNLARFARIQLNGQIAIEDVAQLQIRLMEFREIPIPIITQFDANPMLTSAMMCDAEERPLHQVLFDASGGRGIERSEWPAHLGECVCGYAGGLGPDNLKAELARISLAAGGNAYWIDMEGKLRDEQDRFSVERAYAALTQIAVWDEEVDESLSPGAVA